MTGSLVVPMAECIHKGLFETHERLQELGTVIDTQILSDGENFDMEIILQTMIEDFESRWGDGSDINAYSLGMSDTNKDQPRGYTETQVICYTLDSFMVVLPQVDEDQEDVVWNVLDLRCKDLILVSLTQGSQDSQTSQSSHHLE